MQSIRTEKILLANTVLVSLIFTPVNFDALIIPKISLIFFMALYLIPQIRINQFIVKSQLSIKLLLGISLAILIQMIIVIVTSDAPF
jgi:hypothetical protein